MIMLFSILIAFQGVQVQADSTVVSSAVAVVDSSATVTIPLSVLQDYQEILEKTNSQLSLWWNPYGVLVASLGILFTILTIVAAVIIYFQSKGAKELIQETLNSYTEVVNGFIREKNDELTEKVSASMNDLAQIKEEFQQSSKPEDTSIGDRIGNLENELQRLRSKKIDEVAYPAELSKYSGNWPGISPPSRYKLCDSCNKPFNPTIQPKLITSLRGVTIKCPHCGYSMPYE